MVLDHVVHRVSMALLVISLRSLAGSLAGSQECTSLTCIFIVILDVHTKFERDISEFLGTEDAIIYSQSFSTISSAIPSFCKRGDIIVAQVFLCPGLADYLLFV